MARLELSIDASEADAGARLFEQRIESIKRSARAGEISVQELTNRLTGVGRVSRSAEQSAESLSSALDQEAAAFNRVRTSLDPLFAAQQRYEAEQEQINRAVRFGVVTQEEANRVLAQSAARYRSTEVAVESLANAQTRLRTASGNSSFAFTQLGFQVQDFAVQVAAGQSALVALTQQLPQALGVFGSFGRIALIGSGLGTIAAVALAAGPAIARMISGVKDLDEAMGDLEDSVGRYESAVKLAISPTEELNKRFGENVRLLRAGFEIRSLIELSRAQRDLDAAVTSATDTLAGQFQAIDFLDARFADAADESERLGQVTIGTLRNLAEASNLAEAVAEKFGLSTEEVRAFRNQIDTIQNAEGPQELLVAFEGLAVQTKAILESGREISPELEEMLLALVDSSEEAARILQIMRDVESVTGSAANNASQFAGNLDAALRAVERIRDASSSLGLGTVGLEAQNAALREGKDLLDARADGLIAQRRAELEAQGAIGSQFVEINDQAFAELDAYTQQIREKTAAERENKALVEALRESRGGGSDGSTTAAIDQLRKSYEGLVASIDPARAAQFALEDGVEQIGEALKKGAINGLEAAEAVAILAGRYGEAEGSASAYEKALKLVEEAYQSGRISADEFEAAQARVQDSFRKATQEAERAKDRFSSFFTGIITGANTAQEAFANLAAQIADRELNLFFDRIYDGISASGAGGLLDFLFGGFANGGVFNNGNVVPFASGGVVTQPTLFPLASGRTGLMGEAGAEAIMPLKRGSNGRLGVEASGGSMPDVKVAIFDDRDAIGDFLQSPRGERIILETVRRAGY